MFALAILFLFLLALGSSRPLALRSQVSYSTPTISSALGDSVSPYLVLNNGEQGLLTGSLNSHYKWQASGIMTVGGCERISASLKAFLSCFAVFLASEGQEAPTKRSINTRKNQKKRADKEDWAGNFELWIKQDFGKGSLAKTNMTANTIERRAMSTRQRNEILTWPPAAANEQWEYTWKSWIHGLPESSQYFFHVWQILHRSDGGNGPVISLGLNNGRAVIRDYYRECSDCGSIDLTDYVDKLISHCIDIKYGSSGSFTYTATEEETGKVLLHYSTIGVMGDHGSLKVGLYRRSVDGMSSALGVLADFTATPLF